jgi:hypothetical protein
MAACGLRPSVRAAILIAIAATMTIVGAGIAGMEQANAAPMCPGPTTADGLACCTPGSTPTGDDTCQLPGGGVAASCALSQLTSSGTCCPVSSSPQPDGTCQPAGGFASAPGCPLGQLGKSGLSCCPTGQVPQADGSCQASTAQQPAPISFGVSPCPPGLFVGSGGPSTCTGPATACPAGLQTAAPGSVLNGCCPSGSQPTQAGNAWYCTVPALDGNGNVVQATVPPVAPTCPPGATVFNFSIDPQSGSFFCTAPAICPPRYVLSPKDGVCLLGDTFGGNLRTLPTSTPPPGPAPPAPLPGVVQLPPPPTGAAVTVSCTPGYALNADGSMCLLKSTTCPTGEVLSAGNCVPVKRPPQEPPCPSDKQPGPGGTCVCKPPREACQNGQVQGPDCNCIRAPTCPAGDIVVNGACVPVKVPRLPVSVKTQAPVPCPDGLVRTARGCKKPSSSTTAKPTTTIKSPKLNTTTTKLNLSPKPTAPLKTSVKTTVRTPVKLPARTPVKTTN